MMKFLLDLPLSAEAKAIAVDSCYKGVSTEVSIVINFDSKKTIDKELIRRLINIGWGKEIDNYLCILETHDSDVEALLFSQSSVRAGKDLIAINIARNEKIFMSAHHALADETSLHTFKRLLELTYFGMEELSLQEMTKSRQLYLNYIEYQNNLMRNYINEGINFKMTPVRISKSGRLAWNEEMPRVCLNRVINIKKSHLEYSPSGTFLSFLIKTKEISEDDFICMSSCMRAQHEKGAIGMMTGLVPLSIKSSGQVKSLNGLSLEARAKKDLEARELLKSCRNSELFINGASARGIPAIDVISATFPIGLDFRWINEEELLIEMEGNFCNKNFASELINEWANILSG